MEITFPKLSPLVSKSPFVERKFQRVKIKTRSIAQLDDKFISHSEYATRIGNIAHSRIPFTTTGDNGFGF